MKKVLLSALFVATLHWAFATQHVVTNLGNTYSPNDITIMLGDTVVFALSSSHNVVEVSQATWNANGNTPLGGGVSLPFGGGNWIPATAGVYYYVCDPHASLGMKGKITVTEGMGQETSQAKFSLNIFPNPAASVLNLKLENAADNKLSFSMYNLVGQKIRSAVIAINSSQVNYPIQVADLPRGVYMLTVSTGTAQYTRKIVLE